VVYSLGRITVMWLILRTLSKFGQRAGKTEVISFASRSSLRSGGLPIKDGYNLALIGGFVAEKDEHCWPTDIGLTALGLCDEDEPDRKVRNLLVATLILRRPPAWVACWQGDPNSLDEIIPSGDRELLEAAGLLLPENSGKLKRKAWWLALTVVPLLEETLALRRAIGEAGEELSFRFERARLEAQGLPNLAKEVAWVAKESPAYGFDIASFAGKSFEAKKPDEPLAIEVKSVSYPVMTKFPLHFTAHEYRTAQEFPDNYILHLWSSVRLAPNVGAETNAPRLALLNHLTPHLARASPCGGLCRWDSMFLELPLPLAETPV
jgi:hypothetical protein